MTQENRIEFLDFTKFIAIFFVLWGHILQYGYIYTVDIGFYHNWLFEFIYSFHMPMFALISGLFAQSSLKLTFGTLVNKKFIQLILPSLIWTILYILAVYFRGNNLLQINTLLNLLLLNFWFLTALFVSYLIFYLSIKILKKEGLACILSCVIILTLPFKTQYISFMLPFFWIGYFLKKYLLGNTKSQHIWVLGLLFIALLYFWDGFYTIYAYPIKLINYEKLSINFDNLLITLYRFLIGFVGALFFILLSKKIYQHFENRFNFKILNQIGRETLGIYLAQQLVILVILHLYKFPNTFNINLFNIVISPIYTIVSLTICMFVIYFLKRNRITRLLFLGNSNAITH